MKKIIALFAVLLLTLTFSQNIQAEDTEHDTKININLITSENLTAYINGTADGNVQYYIDGIEVTEEFVALWAQLRKLNSRISSVRSSANKAWNYADQIYTYCDDNNQKIYILRDEIIAFQYDYIIFKNETNNTIGNHNRGLNQHAGLIDQHAGVINYQGQQIDIHTNILEEQDSTIANLNDANIELQETVRAQSRQIDQMNAFLNLIKNSIIILAIIGAIIVIIYLLNRKYPFAKSAEKVKRLLKNIKKQGLPDYIQRSKKAQTKKALIYKIKHTRISRNPEKSPIKLFFSFLQIQK